MTIVQKIVKAGALPAEWRSEFPDPEQLVTVEIRDSAAHSSKVQALKQVMDEMSAYAEAQGLTPEILEDILNER